jgi:hypothetical protein
MIKLIVILASLLAFVATSAFAVPFVLSAEVINPTTMFLLGTGLVGIVTIGRNKINR